MRIDRFLSLNGFGSRKSVKKYFHKGEVKINGEIITDYSTDITGCDVIEVNGIKVSNQPYITIMLNKPEGYLSTSLHSHYRGRVRQTYPSHHQLLSSLQTFLYSI